MYADATFTKDQTTPQDIKLSRADRRLTIIWKDGRVSTYSLGELRKKCPCAACNAERQRQSESKELFPILKKDPGIGPPEALGAKLVGNYALHLEWGDGHTSGIYDFRFLRALDEA